MDACGFSRWSDAYDQDVRQSDQSNTYPFAGYQRIQDTLLQKCLAVPGRQVLDLGIGTGALAGTLERHGLIVTGVDFSLGMLSMARQNAPEAQLIAWDFAQGLPPQLASQAFDLILCNYAIHHLTPPQQRALIRDCMARLSPEGLMLIADAATQSAQQMALARAQAGDLWDDAEHYPVADDVAEWFPEYRVCFEAHNGCSGILILRATPVP